ncbi:MAG: hypothetical protein JWP52_2186 [Rhizobacter sp.]|nr:hypothetical protein [Rhizobacter sp.]
MRIVYLINGLNGGGAAFPMLQVIGLMQELGHDVRVIALMPQDGKAAARLERAGIRYEVIGRGPRDFMAPAWRLIRRLRGLKPDLLWTSLTRGTIYGQWAGRLLSIPVVSWQHSDYLKPGNLAILRRTSGLSVRWIADSEAVSRFVETALRVPPHRIETWPPFVADPAAPTAEPWRGDGLMRLGTLGRLHHSKQYAVLLRAFARAREFDAGLAARIELLFAGDGPERTSLQTLADSLGVGAAVRFIGFVERPSAFLVGLHGYLQTSLKEGFCIAAHEAMQAGLPVIATRVGQLAYSVRPGQTGWLCDVGDVDALARAMLAMAGNPALSAQMGLAARACVLERYSLARFRAVGERLITTLHNDITAEPPPDPTRRSASPPPP